MSDRDITIAVILGDLRRRMWLILAIAAGAAALAYGLSLLQPVRYEATANLLFSDEESNAPERAAATNLALATLDTVVVRVQRQIGGDLSLQELRERVSIAPKGQADIVEVRASGDTREQAERVADAFAREIVAVRVERAKAVRGRGIEAIDAQLAATDADSEVRGALQERRRQLLVEQALEQGDVSVTGEAFAPPERSQPRPLRNGVVGGGAGLLLGLLLALGLRERGRELDEQQVTEIAGCPVLARVPERGSGWRQEAFLESIQFLRTNLARVLDQSGGTTSVAVTSARPNEGKTTIVEQLARALAESGRSVVIVDADLRRGVLGDRFGVPATQPGLAQCLEDGRAGRLAPTSVPGILLLARGEIAGGHALAHVDTAGMRRVLIALRGAADVVLVDTAPVSIAAETSNIAAAADAVVLVVDAANTEAKSLRHARTQLERVDAEIVGIVMNRASSLQRRSDRAAYMAYGVRATDGPGAPAPKPAADGKPAALARKT